MENVIKDQGKVLFFASFTELGERYSYYVIQALLIFFLLDKFHISEAKSSSLVGTALGMIYISAIVGGYIADKLIGHYRTAFIGSILMVLGSFILTISKTENLLFIGLAFISISTGLIKSNMSSFLGNFYDKSHLSDSHRDFGFSIFYVGINLGGLIALFFASSLKDHFGFQVPFYSSVFVTILMFLNLALGFIKLKPYIDHQITIKYAKIKTFLLILAYIILVFTTLKFSKVADYTIFIAAALCAFILVKSAESSHWKKVIVAATFFILSILYWVLFFQIFIAILIFIDKSVSHTLFSFNLSSSQFLAIESLGVIILGSIIGKIWLFFGKIGKPIQDIDKFNLGFIFIGIMFALFYIGTTLGSSSDKLPALIIVIGFIILAISELCLSAIGLSMITKTAPDGYVSLYMGIWLVTLGIGGKLAGFISSFISITNDVAIDRINMRHGFLIFIDLAVLGIIACTAVRKFVINNTATTA